MTAKLRPAWRRPRKVHVQQELLNQAGTKAKSSRGGKRRGAGRPPKGARAGVSHAKREAFKPSEPLHVVLRVLTVVGALRQFDMYRALRAATLTAARKGTMRIVHASIQNTHIHLIVEAESRLALARGMQGFQISAAKWINRAVSKRTGVRRRGSVFSDRYFGEVLRSPRQVRSALAYVLNNWRKHREDRGSALVDKFSTGALFDGWRDRHAYGPFSPPAGYDPLIVWDPRTWLLRTGWRRHGLVAFAERPSPLHRKR